MILAVRTTTLTKFLKNSKPQALKLTVYQDSGPVGHAIPATGDQVIDGQHDLKVEHLLVTFPFLGCNFSAF